MGLRDRLGGGKKDSGSASAAQPAEQSQAKRGRGRLCMYGHEVPRGKKMCEHRHWVG